MTVIPSTTPPISNLPAATALSGAELIPLVQGGTTKRTTLSQVAAVLSSTASAQSYGTSGYALIGNSTSAVATFQGFSQSGAGAATRTWNTKVAEDCISVKDFGAKGDGVTNDTAAIQAAINAAFQVSTASNAQANSYLNKPLYFPAGHYIISSPLVINGAFGVKMFGAGMFASTIENTTPNSSCIVTNGFEYSRISDLMLIANTSNVQEYSGMRGVVLDLDHSDAPTDPQGGTTLAYALHDSTAAFGHASMDWIFGSKDGFTTIPGQSYTQSIYAKADTLSFIGLSINDSINSLETWFNLGTGAIASNDGNTDGILNITGRAISNAGGGWYRCSITFTTTETLAETVFLLANADGVYGYTGTGADLFTYGPMFNAGTSPGTYVPQVFNTCALDLDWDGTYTNVQQCLFDHVYFSGGDFGIRVCNSNTVLGDNLTFVNCRWQNGVKAGYASMHFNVLSNTFFGCQWEGCGIGIWMSKGSQEAIIGCAFEGQAVIDIQIDNGVNDDICVHGCRSESLNFISGNVQGLNLSGIKHSAAFEGYFVFLSGRSVLTNCESILGQVYMPSQGSIVQQCQFGRDDWCVNTTAYVKNTCRGKTVNGQGIGTFVWMDDGVVSYNNPSGDGATFYQKGSGTPNVPFGLTDQANIVTDPVAAQTTTFSVTLAGNRTLNNPLNLFQGATYTWIITQGAGGNHTLAYGAAFTFPGGAPTLSVAAGTVDVLTAIYDGTKLRSQLTKAYA